jgi:putative endonuclease
VPVAREPLYPTLGIPGWPASSYTQGMTFERQARGREAEDAAAACLARAGLAVVERNVRFAVGEIDLVCREGDTWVFVEVKGRQARWGDAPAAAVSWHKQRRLTRLAQTYLKWRRQEHARARFDVVSVTLGEHGPPSVRHIRNAFDAVE